MSHETLPALLADQLETHLTASADRSSGDLRVELEGEGLVLRGCVHIYYAKQLAQYASMDVSGLVIRANDIEVR